MRILIFSPGFPDKKRSNYPFVKQLVDEWARQGHDCTVVTTNSLTRNRYFSPTEEYYKFNGGGSVCVYRTNVITCSKVRLFGKSLTSIFHKVGIQLALRKVSRDYDVVYCHFWQSGADGYLYTRETPTPLFVATGESNITKLFRDADKTFINHVKGVVCVSTKNKQESIGLGFTTLEKCEVFPNSVNPNVFRKLDKQSCRKQLGFPADAFIVIFVGSFKENKGPLRVANAISSIREKNIYSVFIGSGPQNPECNNILFKGRVMHEVVPIYLNSADVFVLPTLAEGCCNAIIEAMACGLPIISSDLPFNWDVLNDKNSIMIDPLDIQQISEALIDLTNNHERRECMSKAALRTAANLTIENRARNIISFINKHK